jgi:DNA-binding protein HU-beta
MLSWCDGIVVWLQPATIPPPAEEMSMTKAEIIDHVAATVHLPKTQTDAVLTQCLQTIMDALQAGEPVELRGFGRFKLRHRSPRTGRNPRTGETIAIPAKAVPTFTAGKAFQERVHSSVAAASGAARDPHPMWR